MEAKYTKANWVVSSISEHSILEISVDSDLICSIHGDSKDENIKANAKLIAAAPQMVDALLKVVQTYNIGSKVNGMPSMTLALAEAICNAETVVKEATE